MSNHSVELTRRRLLGGIISLGTASAAAGAGTVALFSDSESSTGNTVQAGTLEVEFGGSGSLSFNTALAPTESTTGPVTVVNSGSLTGSLDIDVGYTESDGGSSSPDKSADAVAQHLEVTSLTYGGTDLTGQITTSNSPPTLYDLATNDHGSSETTQNDLINLADPGSGTDFTMELRLQNVGNDFQGDGISIDVTFHINQTDGQ